MAISIIDVRKKRKVAMQKIRRAYRKIGVTFKADNIKFETPKKGMSPEELQRLYNRYENIMQGNFMLNLGDGRYIDFATGEIFEPQPGEPEEYEEPEEHEEPEDYIPVGSYIQHAFDLVESLNYPNATNHFEMVVNNAIDVFGVSKVDKWFKDNSEIFDGLYKELRYSVMKNDDSTSFFVDMAINIFETTLMGGLS